MPTPSSISRAAGSGERSGSRRSGPGPDAISAGSRRVLRRLGRVDWNALEQALEERGYACVPRLLTARDCASTARLYDDAAHFRSFVDMARHRFGEGDYRYFASPLPALVASLRRELYPPLARIANRWQERLDAANPGAGSYPATLAGFLDSCHAAGQLRPTPLLLRYAEGGFNCLHQDLYGDVAFPLQVAVLLSRSGLDRERDGRPADFTGGEFVLTEQRPRQQSRAEVVALARGDAVIFPNAVRPVEGVRRSYRARVRHGVSRIHSGSRTTLGVIFHDAR